MKSSLKLCRAAASAIALLCLVPAAQAADLAEPQIISAPAAPFSWTGFYVGANIGYGHAFSNWRFAGFDTVNNHDNGGLIVGGQLGYNFQLANQFVLGLEGSASWANIRSSSLCPNTIFTCGTNTGIYADASLRIGYAFDRLLPYFKGGLSFTERSAFAVLNANSSVRSTSGSDVNIGYLVGAGVEYAFTDNWTAKVEYNFIGFSDRSTAFQPPSQPIPGDGTAFFTNARQRGSDHVIKVGLNYKF